MLVMINNTNSRHVVAQIKHNHPSWTPDQWVNELIKRNLNFIRNQKLIGIKRRKTIRVNKKNGIIRKSSWHRNSKKQKVGSVE